MPECKHCGARTDLRYMDEPICIECANRIDAGKPPRKPEDIKEMSIRMLSFALMPRICEMRYCSFIVFLLP
jgi:hypothetical protein